MGVANDTVIKSAYNVHFLYSTMVSSWKRTAGVINELITAMLEIDLSLTQHESDGKIP